MMAGGEQRHTMVTSQLISLDDPKVGRYYADVPPEQMAQLRAFLAEYPYRRHRMAGVDWQYITAGEGDDALVLLPGALGRAETAWQLILAFAQRRRVLAPSYPPVTTMALLAEGVAGLMQHENIARAAVLGGSYGGFVAQVFARRFAGQTSRLILSHTAYPDTARGAQVKGAARWFPVLPMSMLRSVYRRSTSGLLPEEHPETVLADAQYDHIVDLVLTKRDLVGMYRRIADYDTNYAFTPGDLAGWPGQVLLIFADDDPGTPETVRTHMQELYPGAQLHLFYGTKHAAPVVKRDEFVAVIEEFLNAAG